MRVLFTFLVASTVLLLHVLDNPGFFRRGWGSTKEWGRSTFQGKDVRIEGLRALSRTEVERVLPLDRSVVWWIMNMPVIQAKVADNPWIGKVSVESCSGGVFSEWGCFVVSVTERTPRYLAKVDDEGWVVAEDGTFLVPVSQIAEAAVDPDALIVIEGLASRTASPDIVRAQISLAKRSVDTLERTVGKLMRTISFGSKGDVSVGFHDVPFPVVFSTSADHGVPLHEQGERCAQLLGELAQRFNEIERIDLAFQRVGVVKLKSPPV